MNQPRRPVRRAFGCLAALVVLSGAGCCTTHKQIAVSLDTPRELDKVTHATYVLEAPDIVLIDAVRLVPKPPYKIEPLDSLLINLANPLNEPVQGLYQVEPDGTVNLGVTFGSVKVIGLTIAEAQVVIRDQIAKVVKEPIVRVSLGQGRAVQQVRGEHLVRPDGTVSLGTYGSVYVAGLTLAEAKAAVESHLSQHLQDPEVSVDVFSYNSKVYYIVTDGAGFGEQVYRFPSTGNETVLDAISQINGLPPVSSKKRIWIARPAPAGCPEQLLPVDWKAITRRGSPATNYQVLPGDRIYVQAEPLITAETYLGRIFTPIERVLGITLLGNAVVEAVKPGQTSSN